MARTRGAQPPQPCCLSLALPVSVSGSSPDAVAAMVAAALGGS